MTVRLSDGFEWIESRKLTGTVVSPSEPRTKAGRQEYGSTLLIQFCASGSEAGDTFVDIKVSRIFANLPYASSGPVGC